MFKRIVLLLLIGPTALMAQIDRKATRETKNLYNSLKQLRQKGVLFGQQDALAYGLNKDGSRWVGDPGRSDIKTLTGEHPAVVGHDLGHLELDSLVNLDGVPFEKIRQSIVETYRRGGVNTISWHPNNPLDFTKTTWDKGDSTIHRILTDRTNRKSYEKTLDRLADFFRSLKGPEGEYIPVIFRPYHEHTGNWFWWGAGQVTPEEYKAFWRFTVDYLRKKRKVHNLLYAYSTDYFGDEAHYLERYPGDQYVDILGFDYYHRNAPQSNTTFIETTRRMVGTIRELGQQRGKVWALTETGLDQLPEPTWWTSIIQPIVQDSGLSYLLVWRNGRADHFFGPYPGQASAEDLRKLVGSGTILLEQGVARENIYSKR
ncbi:glycoside hydrolase family 26 protein [Telluribacter sp. SYSU D00476]|uniref:glycoside hydrolase family 26 protein n=1 Tax=Telluribacter sp. SYSU D00476 TaxID=2811430 RepID=UPI001FF695FC|nr:glycosyl hydrolase [Telluribacter sp. SYSU D00476]